MTLAPRLRALRVASPPSYRGQHLRLGEAASAVFLAAPHSSRITNRSKPTVSDKRLACRGSSGFTLIELLVAIGAMALLALMSWRGLDAMAQAQAANRVRGDAMLTLQTTLTQWNADLDAVLQLAAGTTAIDWDGRVLRLTRRGSDEAAPAVHVVAWALRSDADGAQWRRWQSPPFSTRAAWNQAWSLAASWGQDGASEARRSEVVLLPLESWQLFYFRNGAWSPAIGADALGGLVPVPDGVRLVLSLPPGPSLAGLLTRDWVRPTLSAPKT